MSRRAQESMKFIMQTTVTYRPITARAVIHTCPPPQVNRK